MKRTLKSRSKKVPQKKSEKTLTPKKFVFPKFGYLSHVDLFAKSNYNELGQQLFLRKIHHSALGEMEERAFINRGTLKSDPCGKMQVMSTVHGRIGEINFKKIYPKTYFLHSLEVIPWARKQGLGTQIFLSTIDLLKKQLKAEKIILNVDKKDTRVIQMYKRMGFIESKEIGFEKTNAGEIQMVLKTN